MANAFSLTNQGSTPSLGILKQSNPFALKTPYSGSIATQAKPAPAPNSGLVNTGTSAPLGGTPVKTSGYLPSTPVKSVTATDGTKTEFHAPATAPGTPPPATYKGTLSDNQVNIGTKDKPNIQTNGVPNTQPGTTQPSAAPSVNAGTFQPSNVTDVNGQAPTSIDSNGNQVPIDPSTGMPYHTTTLQSAANAVNAARQSTPEEQYYNNMAISGKELSNHNTLDPYAEQGFYNGTNGAQLGVDLNAPDLQGRAAGEAGLSGGVGNIFGSAAQTGLTNSIAMQQQNLGGAEALLNSAAPVTQAGMLTNPYTGQPLNPSLVANAVQQANQLVSNGTPITDPTVQSLLSPFGFYGTSALVQAQQAMSGGDFNPANQSAAGQAAAQNVGTAGTSSTQTAAAGYSQSLPSYIGASTAFSTASQQANNLLNTMNGLGINSSDAQDWNQALNAAGSKLGSSKLTAFTATLAEAQQAYTNLLSSVGAATPTVNGEQATAIFNPSSTPSQIAAAVDALNQAAYAKLEPQYQQALTYYNQLHGTNVTEIPGNPPPKLPVPVSSSTPKSADTAPGNLLREGAVAAGEGLLSLGGTILSHITALIP